MRRVALVCLMLAGALHAEPWRAGRAAVVITPPVGTPMAGYYALRRATGTHDDLHAKALVLEAQGVRVALVACDLVNLPPAITSRARQLASEQSGIPTTHIMLSATHSHTGPLLPGEGRREAAYGGEDPLTRQYAEQLPGRIAEAVVKATRDLQPARLFYAQGSEGSVSFNRRFHMKDGTVGWNPGKLNPNIVRAAGPIDPALPLLYAETPDGKPLATYVNFALHLDTVGGTEFSADYPHTLASLLGRVKGPDMLTLFTIGAAGNVNHLDVRSAVPQKGHGEAARIGGVLAGEVLKAYTRLRPVTAETVRVRSEMVTLEPASLAAGDVERAQAVAARVGTPQNPLFLDTVFAFKALDVAAREGRAYLAEVQVIALGDEVAWVALPGEVFTELGQAIRRDSLFRHTFVVTLAHGPTTYFPDEPAFAQGNYEVVTSRCAPGSGERLVAAAGRLLRALHAVTPTQPITLFNGRDLAEWTTWLRAARYGDPQRVFTVQDGLLRISGQEWGGVSTRDSYRDYRLMVEWAWGQKTWPPREKAARDSGILVHGTGPEGAHGGVWLESIEAQIIEGGSGDILVVPGEGQPSLTAEARTEANGETYWERGAPLVTRTRGRFNWFGRDPAWKDVLGVRGPRDLEKPPGEWNRLEVECEGDQVRVYLNGVLVNEGQRASPTQGRIQLQSEGAEIRVRRVELLPLGAR